MASSEEIRVIFNAETSKLLAGMREAKQSTSDFGKTFKDVSSIITSSAGFMALASVFKNAVTSANKMEVAMLGVKSAAQQSGKSFDEARSAVIKLSEDGVLGIENIGQTMKMLLSQGLSVDKAFELTNALKKIGSLNNIVGNTSQAVSDFVKGLASGSQELVENLDPNLRSIITKFGGLAAMSKDASKRQDLFNALIERGGKLTGAYNEYLKSGTAAQERFTKAQEFLSASIGATINTALAPIMNWITEAINNFREFFEGLSEGTRQIVVFGGAFVVLVPIIAGAIKAIGTITSLVGGPWTLAITGAVALIVGLVAVFNELNPTLDETISKTSEHIATTQQLIQNYTEAKKESDKLGTSTNRLEESELALKKAAQAMGIILYDNNGVMKDSLKLQKELLSLNNKELSQNMSKALWQKMNMQGQYNAALQYGNKMLQEAGVRTASSADELLIWRNAAYNAGKISWVTNERLLVQYKNMQLAESGTSKLAIQIDQLQAEYNKLNRSLDSNVKLTAKIPGTSGGVEEKKKGGKEKNPWEEYASVARNNLSMLNETVSAFSQITMDRLQTEKDTALANIIEVNDAEIFAAESALQAFNDRKDMEDAKEGESADARKARNSTEKIEYEKLQDAKKAAEEKKAKAIDAINTEMAKKEKDAKRKAALYTQTISLAETAMQGAQAIVAAWTTGPVAGVITSLVVGGLLASKLAMIRSTAIPEAAEGALIKGSQSGSIIRAGERGRSEAIIPLENPDAMRKLGGIGGVTININANHFIGDTEKFPQELAVKIDQALYKLRRNNASAFAESL